MYSVSITKVEKRRLVRDRRESNHNPSVPERRTSNDRRTIDDRRNAVGRRLGIYLLLSDKEKERLNKIINIHNVEEPDLIIG